MGCRRLPRAEDDLAPDRSVAAPLAHREWGDPAAPALVFWPGLQLPAHATLNAHGPGLAVGTARRVLAVSARLPILLVVASETVATEHGRRALERFRAAIPAAEVAELDSGHDLLADAPSETLDCVAKFLREAGSRRSPG